MEVKKRVCDHCAGEIVGEHWDLHMRHHTAPMAITTAAFGDMCKKCAEAMLENLAKKGKTWNLPALAEPPPSS